MEVLIAGIVGLPVFLLLVGSLRQRAFAAAWELILTPRGVELYRQMKEQLEADLEIYDSSHARAAQLRDLGSTDEAMRLMRAGCELIERAAPDRIAQLAAMTLLTRLVVALAPVTPLRPRRFHMARIATAAGLAWFFHFLLVTAAERLRLKLLVLRYGFRAVARLLGRSGRRLEAGAPGAGAAWTELEGARADYGSLSAETLECFRTILLGMGAERKTVALARDYP